MGVHVQPSAITVGSTMNYNRVTALEKWKTDWFHETSNLFTVTTDQVIGCNESQSAALHEADSTSKYHSRMLQNRAKLNMVVSMVERYVKGALSVEHPSANLLTTLPEKGYDISSNITPWTMVSPDEVCPMDRHNQESLPGEQNLKKRFTVDEALETLSQDDESINFEVERSNEEYAHFPSNDVEVKHEDPSSDLLAQACEIINKRANTGTESDKDVESNYEYTSNIPQHEVKKSETSADSPDSPDTPTIRLGHSNPIQIIGSPTLTTSAPPITQLKTAPTTTKSLKLVNGKSLQSMIASGAKFVILAPANGKIKNSTTPIISAQQIAAKQAKLVEIVPATLPDGRVIHLELTRTPSPTQSMELGGNKTGVRHVILPQPAYEKTQKRSYGKIIPVRKYNATLASQMAAKGKLNQINDILNNKKAQKNVPMVYLKRPSKEIVFANNSNPQPSGKIVQITPVPPGVLSNLQQSDAQVVFQNIPIVSSNTSITRNESVVSQMRNRTLDGEVKLDKEATTADVNGMMVKHEKLDSEISSFPQESNCNGHSEMKTLECNTDQAFGDEEFNFKDLNEFMDQLPSPGEGNDDIGSLCHDDILDDMIREAGDPERDYNNLPISANNNALPGFVDVTETTRVSTESNCGVAKESQPTLRGGSRVHSTALSYTLPAISAVHPVLQEVENMIKRRNASNENRKRKALSSIDYNARGDNPIEIPKPKRKYTKRMEVKEGADEKSSVMILGPTAAAAAKNPYHKPPLPYNILIYLAFKDAKFRCLTVKQIYNFVLKTFPYFTEAHQTWQNAIRHQLCCCKIYVKVPLVETENGVEKLTARSAWKISNDESISKLEDDAVSTIMKKDTMEKLKLSLFDPGQFSVLFGDVLASADEQSFRISENARNVQTYWQNNSEFCSNSRVSSKSNNMPSKTKRDHSKVQKMNKSESQYLNNVEISPPILYDSSTADDDDLSSYHDFPLFESLSDSPHSSPFFDISPKTVEKSSIYNF
uniref:uncharacterized protein LOC120342057 n=1 Tax=Styela clava TaxID=7725 RepID=UPI00193ACC81|nr:uncharacterized protein LOC120342057 [Styela clava]XP_039266659.1 uncharacterized protein LOC120342057 [Styela clava]XP_039266660.1 uncharacterized protein LOC120342057 [Styela clava]